MHILYLHQHFAVPSGSTGTRSYEFARRWINAGHKVTIITGHYDIGGLEYSNAPQFIEKMKIVIAGTKYSNKQSSLRRVLSFLGFIFWAFTAGLKQKKVDVIYATSTPLTVGVSAILLKWFKRIPFVFEVRDQWPEIPIALGYIKNSFIKNILLYLEKRIYVSASAIVALSPGMAAGVKLVLDNVKREIIIVSNASDLDRFKPEIDGSEIRSRHGWNNKFIILHFGAMGKANGLFFLIEVAEKLIEKKNIHIVIIGDGTTKETLVNEAKKRQLANIEFLDSIAKVKLPEYIAAADVSVVIVANYTIMEYNSANKFFDSLSAGKPILLNYSGWQRKILEDNDAGFGCKLHDLDEFVEKVLYLSSNAQELESMGKNARLLAEKEFSRNLLSSKVLNVLESVVDS